MQIGFDAKRAFFNRSGLGNYSRNLIRSLISNFPENKYLLYTSGLNPGLFDISGKSVDIVTPAKSAYQLVAPLWRSIALTSAIKRDKPDIYHGLSHELPYGIKKIGIKSVVTIHDLIFFRYPELYHLTDRIIYREKFRFACKNADQIVAVSRRTADDIIEFYKIDPGKIKVVYQSYHPAFEERLNDEQKKEIRKKYSIPENYVLYVGTIEKRKNLLGLIRAVHHAKIDFPVVAIGKPSTYFSTVRNYVNKHHLKNIIFIESVDNQLLPAFYQMAEVFVYPSLFEGFGIPILESLVSGTPVITSKGGCFSETGGPSSIYTDPMNIEELGNTIKEVLINGPLREKMSREGISYSKNFSPSKSASNMMDVYHNLLKH